MYYCEDCNYKTEYSGNFCIHKKSKKHLKNMEEKSKQIEHKYTKSIDMISDKYQKSIIIDTGKNKDKFECEKCGSEFSYKNNYYRHRKYCKENNKTLYLEKELLDTKLKLEFSEKEKELYKRLGKERSELLNIFLVNSNKDISEDIFNIDIFPNNNLDINLENNNKNNLEDNYTLLINNVIIMSRKIDNYINATQLCKAGNKKFNDWIRIDNTKDLISELESETGIPASQLIDIKKGNSSEFEQGSWIHPDLAIQLAQWISSKFALQVSKWIRTLFSNNKVEIALKKLKDKENEIQKKK